MEIGDLRHHVTLQNPGPPIPDGGGGYTEVWEVVGQLRMPASVEPATARSLERVAANTVTATASHLVTIRYLIGVTTETRLTFHDGIVDRVMEIAGWQDVDERHRFLTLVCTEKVQ